MKNLFHFLLIAAIAAFFFSCDDEPGNDDNTVPGGYQPSPPAVPTVQVEINGSTFDSGIYKIYDGDSVDLVASWSDGSTADFSFEVSIVDEDFLAIWRAEERTAPPLSAGYRNSV